MKPNIIYVKQQQKNENTFGIPYRPRIWGAGWMIQMYGLSQYFLHVGFPDIFPKENTVNALFCSGMPSRTQYSFICIGRGGKRRMV